MLMVISPAKTLDFDTPAATDQYTQPDFLDHSAELDPDAARQEPAGNRQADEHQRRAGTVERGPLP